MGHSDVDIRTHVLITAHFKEAREQSMGAGLPEIRGAFDLSNLPPKRDSSNPKVSYLVKCNLNVDFAA